MELADLPVIKIETVTDGKYLVAEVVDGSNNSKIVMRAADYGVNHSKIAEALKTEIGELKIARYLGGGKIWMPRDEGSIYLFDASGNFGMDQDRQRTIAIIQEALPNQKVSEL